MLAFSLDSTGADIAKAPKRAGRAGSVQALETLAVDAPAAIEAVDPAA
jgi:hypothetical protein